MNPSFHEITQGCFWEEYHHIFHTPYSGCKIVGVPRKVDWDLICSVPAKVILMCRSAEEIRQSQEASYRKARASYGSRKHAWMYELGMDLIGNDEVSGIVKDPESKRILADLFNERLNELPDPDMAPWEVANASLVSNQANAEVRLAERKKRVNLSSFTDTPLPPFDFKAIHYHDLLNERERMVQHIGSWIGAEPSRFEYAWLAVEKHRNRFQEHDLVKGI